MIVRIKSEKRGKEFEHFLYSTAKQLDYDLPRTLIEEYIDKLSNPIKNRIAETIDSSVVARGQNFQTLIFAFKGKVNIEIMKRAYFAYKLGLMAGFTTDEYLSFAVAYTHSENHYILAGFSKEHLPSGKTINIYYHGADLRRVSILQRYICKKLNLEYQEHNKEEDICIMSKMLFDSIEYRNTVLKKRWRNTIKKINFNNKLIEGDYGYIQTPTTRDTIKAIGHILESEDYNIDYKYIV